jgi:hypothetical protein
MFEESMFDIQSVFVNAQKLRYATALCSSKDYNVCDEGARESSKMLTVITVYKLDHAGRETFRYTGTITAQGPGWIRLESIFAIPDMDRGYVVFRKGDRFVEWYDSARWYNIFEIHDVTDDHLKGWYCNITRPAIITAESIAWPDLALDVWVSPRGQIRLEDEDEFTALPIDAETRSQALCAAEELCERVKRGEAPFDQITDCHDDSPR